MKDYINEFILYLKNVKNASENTIQSYSRDVYAYIDYIKHSKNNNLSLISEDFICSYIKHLEEANSTSSISRIISSIKCYYKFLQSLDLCQAVDLSCFKTGKKTIKRSPIILSKEEIKSLIDQPDTTQLKGIRDKAMLELLYATGITVTELISLNVNSLNLTIGFLNVSNRTIPLYKDAIKTLSLYVNKVRTVLAQGTNNKKLFCNLNGEQITRQGVWKIIKEYSQSAGIDKAITPHTIRHTFAVHLLENGAELSEVQLLLGHTSATATQVYVDIIKSMYHKSYSIHHPMSK